MKILKRLFTATAAAMALSGMAETVEVVQIKYSDGIIDYIPADEIAKISITKGVDAQSPLYSKVNDMFSYLTGVGTLYSSVHYDFGYPAMMIALDSRTEDVPAADCGYNWFLNWSNFTQGNLTVMAMMWSYMYNTIAAANDIIFNTETHTDENRLMVAQARALKSWAYWNLVQTYAKNPALHPDTDGVVVLEGTSTTGTFPLQSARYIYSLIMDEINQAVHELEDLDLTPANLNVAEAKQYIDLATAYGLRARYNLTQHLYEDAAADARRAIEATSARPLQLAAAAYPGFNDAKLGNWMWAMIVHPQDIAGYGVINFSSMMCNFSDGYTTTGCIRGCGTDLHNYLESQPDDVRRNWFVDSNGQSSNLTKSQQTLLDKILSSFYATRWANIKFDSYMSKLNSYENAADVPLMRVEEMYLIEAEGMAMSGKTTEALELLNSFVKTYRNPSYDFNSTVASEIQNEILWQRRSEFWGEGIVYLDKLRLELDVDRMNDDNWNQSLRYRIRGTSPWMLFNFTTAYPQVEGFDASQLETKYPTLGSEWNE